MSNLITVEEFVSFRSISKKVDEAKVNEAIELAQESDLFDILGGFYFDLVKNSAETSYNDLMNGSSFEYKGEEFIHKGIKKYLADLTYARFMYNGNIKFTPFGIHTKQTSDSIPVDRNTIKDLSKQAQVDANIKFNIIQKYLLSKPEIFKRYNKEQGLEGGFGGVRISKL